MEVTKKILAEFDKLYAVAGVVKEGRLTECMAATEGTGGCVSVDLQSGESVAVWAGPGGTMTLLPLGSNGNLLAVQRFFPVFAAAHAELVFAKKQRDQEYQVVKCMDFPYLHRFDVVDTPVGPWLVAATLCGGKTDLQDWSRPGAVFVGKLPEDPTEGIAVSPLVQGITKNHGFARAVYHGADTVFVSGAEGLFALHPPATEDQLWSTERLLEREISDMAVFDLDGDGEEELVCIEGFHGNEITINHREKNGWNTVWRCPVSFGHALWAGKIGGIPCVVGGYRRGEKQLFATFFKEGFQRSETVVLGNGGPSQICVYPRENGADILSADREDGRAVLYSLRLL